MRGVAISLMIHFALFFPMEKLLTDFRLSAGAGSGRINASLLRQQGPVAAATNSSADGSRSVSSVPNEQWMTPGDESLPRVFGKKEQYTAAVKNSSRDVYVESLPSVLAMLDEVEVGAYRISVARALRRRASLGPLSAKQDIPHELVLELRFIKPMSPPAVSILKSSGDRGLDRELVEAVSEATSGLPPPADRKSLPYRLELPFWIGPEQR